MEAVPPRSGAERLEPKEQEEVPTPSRLPVSRWAAGPFSLAVSQCNSRVTSDNSPSSYAQEQESSEQVFVQVKNQLRGKCSCCDNSFTWPHSSGGPASQGRAEYRVTVSENKFIFYFQ